MADATRRPMAAQCTPLCDPVRPDCCQDPCEPLAFGGPIAWTERASLFQSAGDTPAHAAVHGQAKSSSRQNAPQCICQPSKSHQSASESVSASVLAWLPGRNMPIGQSRPSNRINLNRAFAARSRQPLLAMGRESSARTLAHRQVARARSGLSRAELSQTDRCVASCCRVRCSQLGTSALDYCLLAARLASALLRVALTSGRQQ